MGCSAAAVHAELVAAGAPPEATSVAIDRVVVLAGWARRGWREAAVKGDPGLRTVLGLSSEQCTGRSESGEVYAAPRAGPRIGRLIRGGPMSLRTELAALFYRSPGRSTRRARASALSCGTAMCSDASCWCRTVGSRGSRYVRTLS